MKIERVFIDTEHGNIITESMLFDEWKILFRDGETESSTFTDYIINCTDKNGTLEELV